MLHTKAIRYVWLATGHFSGIIKLNSVKSVQLHLYLIRKLINVFVPWKVLTNITGDALNVMNQTFGIRRPNNANGVLKASFIKRSVVDASVQQAAPTYRMESASTVQPLNTGIISISHVSDALIHLFMIRKSSNVYVL